MWIEMARDEEHGGDGWRFTECLWAPTQRRNGTHWAFWRLLDVKRRDTIIHLRGKTHEAAFVGYSIADADGYETSNRPPRPGAWGHAKTFYRVPLAEYTPFAAPLPLDRIFASRETALRTYFDQNKTGKRRELLFYVIQGNKLQCLNGAYLSEISGDLAEILFGVVPDATSSTPGLDATLRTGQQVAVVQARLGQQLFSDSVRRNYEHVCCFPGCTVADRQFLVGAHIARWADAPELRGEVSNGLCLCLMHDRAFETGLFTLTAEHNVWVNEAKTITSQWAVNCLLPHHGEAIRSGHISPSLEALESHWNRIGCHPTYVEL